MNAGPSLFRKAVSIEASSSTVNTPRPKLFVSDPPAPMDDVLEELEAIFLDSLRLYPLILDALLNYALMKMRIRN